ncbi:MAG: hypothetical protein ACLFUR_01970 [Candidatus Hadarchaeia archaeon]
MSISNSLAQGFSKSKWRRNWHFILLVVAIVATIITGYILVTNPFQEEKEDSSKAFFESLELKEKRISTNEITQLAVNAKNPTDNSYEKEEIVIRIFTKARNIEVSHPDQRGLENVNGEREINLPICRGFNPGGTSGVYIFNVFGSLKPGQTSSTNSLEVEILARGEVKSTASFELTIVQE